MVVAMLRKQVTIYSDGGCTPNPGIGGYGVVLVFGLTRRELSGGCRWTTNNRMELLGAIRGLEALREHCEVRLVTDSQYVVNGIMKGWAVKWRSNGWRRNRKDVAENHDLWAHLLGLCEMHTVQFEWVRGHTGHPENERCDMLATLAARQPDLPDDPHYSAK